MTMQPLDERQYEEWDRFVAKANGTIFHNAWWYRAWGVKFDIYVRRDENGDIEAGMPVYISGFRYMPKVFGVRGLTKPPLTSVNGPLFMDSAKAGRSSRYAHGKKETLCALSSLPKVDFYDIFLHSFHVDLMPYIWNGFDTQVYYTYVIPATDAGKWRGNMSPRMRNYLNGAYKEAEARGCRVEIDPQMADMLPLFSDTAQNKGYSIVRVAGKLPQWWEAVKEKGAGRSYMLRDSCGKALCAALMVWDARSAYFLFNGILSDQRRQKSHINMLLFERMITDSLEMGLAFDFEGSTLIGVESFFRGWGGEMRPCYRVTKSPSLLTYIGLKGHRFLKFHSKRHWVSQEQVR